MSPAPADGRSGQAADACVDALYDLLHARAQSIGLLDIAIELNDGHIDAELLFTSGPDIGVTVDVAAGTAAYCELLEADQERWLETRREGLAVTSAANEELTGAVALEVLDGLLAARRELIRGIDA